MAPSDILLNIGYLTILLALTIKEIFWLRITMTIAQAIILVGNLAFSDNYTTAFWNGIFMTVNIVQIAWLYYERRPRLIPDEYKNIYDSIFNMFTHKEFLYLINLSKKITKSSEIIIQEGERQNNLLLILDGSASVSKEGKKIATLTEGQFISELSFITSEPASANVVADKKITYLSWTQDELNVFKKTNPSFYSKFHNILTTDIVKKITG